MEVGKTRARCAAAVSIGKTWVTCQTQKGHRGTVHLGQAAVVRDDGAVIHAVLSWPAGDAFRASLIGSLTPVDLGRPT